MKVLFLLAFTSRCAAMPMLGHWAAMPGMLLIGAPIDWVADYTLIATVALAVGILLMVALLNRDGRISARMSRGPAELLRCSMLLIAAAMASSVGGLLLLLHGAGPAALWAMGLGTFVGVCEISAIVGSIFLDALESRTTKEER